MQNICNFILIFVNIRNIREMTYLINCNLGYIVTYVSMFVNPYFNYFFIVFAATFLYSKLDFLF
jgi:hypothetical protein